MATIANRWTAVLAATAAMLLDLKDLTMKVATLVAAIPWWGAAVTGTGLQAGTVIVTGKNKPGAKQKNGNAPMVKMFPDLDKGNHNEFNLGCLFALCCQLANVKGWKAAETAEAWSLLGKRYGITSGRLLEVSGDSLRAWYMGPESLHNATGLRAAINNALDSETAARTAAVEAKAAAKAAKGTGSKGRKPQASQSIHHKQSDGMTRTEAKADDLKWLRRDRAGFYSDLNRRIATGKAHDKAIAKQQLAAETKAAKAATMKVAV